MNDFELSSSRRAKPQQFPILWHFISTFLAVSLAGALLLFCVRVYIQWSVADALQKNNETIQQHNRSLPQEKSVK